MASRWVGVQGVWSMGPSLLGAVGAWVDCYHHLGLLVCVLFIRVLNTAGLRFIRASLKLSCILTHASLYGPITTTRVPLGGAYNHNMHTW